MGGNMKIGCIGTGAMGGAIMRAVCKKYDVKNILVTDKNVEMGKAFAKETGATFVASNKDVLTADYIFLAVKPQFLGDVFDEIASSISEKSVIISMAAGVKIEKLNSWAPKARFIRMMPNVCAMIGQAMTALSYNSNITKEDIYKAFETQKGEIDQYPPVYSALKVNGQKMCDLARKGKADNIEIKPRKVKIENIEILNINDNKILFLVKCSKGTYVRSICHDIGNYLKCGGHMSFLLRTSSGKFNLENSITLEELELIINQMKIIFDNAILNKGTTIKDGPVFIYTYVPLSNDQEKADNIKDMLEIERQLNEVESELESIEGRMKRLTNQIEFSTISLNFTLPVGKTENGFVFPDYGEGFREFAENFFGFLRGFILAICYIVVFGTPLVGLFLLLFWLLFGKVGIIRKIFMKLKK